MLESRETGFVLDFLVEMFFSLFSSDSKSRFNSMRNFRACQLVAVLKKERDCMNGGIWCQSNNNIFILNLLLFVVEGRLPVGWCVNALVNNDF